MRKVKRAYKNVTSAALNSAGSAAAKVSNADVITHVNITCKCDIAATASSTAANKLAWWNGIKFSLTHSGYYGKIFDQFTLAELAGYADANGGAVEFNPPSAGNATAESVGFRASIPIGAIDIEGKETLDLLLEWPLEGGTPSVKSNSEIYMSTANLGVNAEQGVYVMRREALILSSSGPVPLNLSDDDITDVWLHDPSEYVDSVVCTDLDMDATREDLLVSSYADSDYASSSSSQSDSTTELNTPAIFMLTLIERDLTEAAKDSNVSFNITGASSTGTIIALIRRLRQEPERMVKSHGKAAEKAKVRVTAFEQKKPMVSAVLKATGGA